MELTIQELATRVGMTPRNIREWQTIGVLPPPQRRGRAAFYGEDHVDRIERVKSLRADGFPLDVIRQFLERSAETAADVRNLTALLDPATHGGTSVINRAGLAERLGDDAEAHLVAAGLVELTGDDEVRIKDVVTFEYIERLARLGLPVAAVVNAIDALTQRQAEGVSALADVYRERIWQPFVEAGLPTDQWRSIAETSTEFKDLVIGVGAQTMRRATDIVIGQIAVAQATELDSRR